MSNGLQSRAGRYRAYRERPELCDEAEARLELARAERDRVQSEEWQMRFMVWTAYLEANDNDLGLAVLAGLGAVATFGALVAGYNIGRRLQ
jgi:hypothetical protein